MEAPGLQQAERLFLGKFRKCLRAGTQVGWLVWVEDHTSQMDHSVWTAVTSCYSGWRHNLNHVTSLFLPALPTVASTAPEPSSALLWVSLGSSQRSTVAPAHQVLDSRGEAKNLRVIFFYLAGTTFSQGIRSIDSNISLKTFRKPSPRKIFKKITLMKIHAPLSSSILRWRHDSTLSNCKISK